MLNYDLSHYFYLSFLFPLSSLGDLPRSPLSASCAESNEEDHPVGGL